ncbi:MAG: sec-independent protein translocase protein TatC [Thermoplasmata archaeon]|jgi:sec-independent protein translocase protein TatC|nr:sec-independent protein translocase protein TatC [Thermoplasmata archaeon]
MNGPFVGRAMSTRWALLALLLVLSAPLAAASYAVRLEAAGDAWNGQTTATPAGGSADLWVPATARIHEVVAQTPTGNQTASWRAQGSDLLRVQAPPNATSLAVGYDFVASPYLVAAVALPAGATLDVLPPPGLAIQSDDAAFAQQPDGAWRATLQAPATVRVHAVDPDRVGEVPILVTVVAVALLSFLGTLLWHKLRPPLQGKPAERFLEHLVELQQRLMPPVVVFAFLNFWYFASGLRLVRWHGYTLVAPTFSLEGSLAARAFQAFAERLVPAGVQLVVLRPADAVLAQVQMTLFLAFVSVLPVLLYELSVFIAPAMRERERRVATRSIPLVTLLFLAGAAFGYLVMTPLMIRALYGFAPATGAAPLLVVGDLISFGLIVICAFGLAFELPVLMYVTSRLGLVQARTYRRYLRHAIVAIVILAGIVTPDPSVVSQLLVAIPVTTLYLIGMGAAAWGERKRARMQDARAAGA